MSSYLQAVKKYDEQHRQPEPAARSSFNCAAHGCPNAGSMSEGGGQGLCYWHYREPEPSKWPEITLRIRSNFDGMRNHGTPSAQVKAKHRAEADARIARLKNGGKTPPPAEEETEA